MPETIEQEALVLYGGAVKALGDGRIGGYLATFSGAEDPDLSAMRDFFTPETDFDLDDGAGKASVYYAHGQDPHLGKRRLGKAALKADDAGVWAETQLALRDDYEKKIYELAVAGKLGWSSGSTSHLVERKATGDAHHVLHWPITEASLTPCPAEPRCGAVALKSLSVPDLFEADSPTAAEHAAKVVAFNADYAERLESRLEARTKAGRVLSAANRQEIEGVLASLEPVTHRLRAVLERATPAPLAPEPSADSPLFIPTGDDLYRLLVAEERFAAS